MTDRSETNLEIDSSSDVSVQTESDQDDVIAIVGIGASAGGLDAFTQIFHNLPEDTGMGFVLIQHLSPDHGSHLSEILRNSTKMPVNEAKEGMRIVQNCVYVIPPNTSMTLVQGVLRLEPRQSKRGKWMVIDGFFNSLAEDCGSRAIAVVLSGSNEDGTAGLGAVKSAGGITFAQSLASAEFPTMPMTAISSGYVDFVLSPTDIATKLASINDKTYKDDDSTDDSEDQANLIFTEGAEALQVILEMLHSKMGVDFCHYKKGTVRRRILRQMGMLSLHNLDDYKNYLQEHPSEIEKLYHDILINVTSFFRDPESFTALQQIVFPEICQNKSSDAPIRIWVAGCSTGEEVYSIAISLLEFFDNAPVKHTIQIFGTDISEIAISKARLGIYKQETLTGITESQLRRFFVPVTNGYQIGKSVRELCVFARQNLTSDPPFSRLDLISCRNMLIYLELLLQKKIMPIFHYALNHDSFLMLGSAEGIGSATDLFEIVEKKYRIYRRKNIPSGINFNFAKNNISFQGSSLAKTNELAQAMSLDQISDQIVLNRYSPIGVTINSDLDIIKFRGQTNLYLEPSSGKASLNLLKMVRPELRLELRGLLHQAKQQDAPVTKEGVEIKQGSLLTKIDVIPLHFNNANYFLVLFESHENQSLATSPVRNHLAKSRKIRQTEAEIEVARLTDELEKNKEYLRSIIEAQELTNQDLKVASEEFLSSNEELQSTNEELETAKEEIQATNEELSTINDELQSRNNQLNLVNNDLQNLLSSVSIPILMLSGELRIRRFTPKAEKIFNLITSDVGRPFNHIRTNLNVPHLIDLVADVIESLLPLEQEVQDNSGHWHILRIRPYRTSENKIDGAVISLIDIDLLKRSALDLESSRNYANAIIETLRQPLLVLDSNLKVVTANLAFYQMFHMFPNQVEHQSLFEIGQREWNIVKLRSMLSDILKLDISVQDYEITQVFPQIGTRTMMLNACQIYQTNVGTMILIAIEDITERKQQKKQLTAKNQELSEEIIASDTANLAKSRFLGNMSHELRTPLNSILGFTQLLQTNPNLDPESKQSLDMIYQAGEYLLLLIQDLLDIAKIEAEKMEIEPNILAFADFLQITVEMISFKAVQKNLAFTTQFADDLPINIYADEKRLRQVILNLLGNAIKFTSTGEIIFSVKKITSTQSAGSPRELIQFAIADNGAGIAAADLEKIFLPFEQVGGLGMKPQGTGLGLAISSNLVSRMGGELKVVSAIGKGSKFSFELDVMENNLNRELVILSPQMSSALSRSVSPSNKLKLATALPLDILIAEDFELNQVVIQKFLLSLGYEADVANNGLEVLDRMREKQYDVILMDIEMPEMNGMQTMKKIIMEWDEASRPYVIALTANTMQKDKKKYLAAGMDAYICKPIDFGLLEQALCQVKRKS